MNGLDFQDLALSTGQEENNEGSYLLCNDENDEQDVFSVRNSDEAMYVIFLRHVRKIPLLNPKAEKELCLLILQSRNKILWLVMNPPFHIKGVSRLQRKAKSWLWDRHMPASRSGFLRLLEKLLEQEASQPTFNWLQQIKKEVEARQGLINDLASANLRLVFSIASEYKKKPRHWFIMLSDFIQEGSIGLMRACEKFDLSFKCKFSTYVSTWIHQACSSFVAVQTRQIRLPSYIREDVGIVIRAERQLVNEKGRPAADEEVAEMLGWPIERVYRARELPNVSSLNVPIGDDGDEYGDFIPDPKEFPIEEIILVEKTQKLLSELSSREEKVIRGRFAVGSPWRTLESLGQEFKVSREWIRQLEKRSMKKLRARAQKQGLDEFLK